MAGVTDYGTKEDYDQACYFRRDLEYLHEERQEYQAQAEGDDISHREPEKLSDHPFAFYGRSEGDIFMKDIGVCDRKDVAGGHGGHIGDIPERENPGEYRIEQDENKVPEDSVPAAYDQEPDALTVIGPLKSPANQNCPSDMLFI